MPKLIWHSGFSALFFSFYVPIDSGISRYSTIRGWSRFYKKVCCRSIFYQAEIFSKLLGWSHSFCLPLFSQSCDCHTYVWCFTYRGGRRVRFCIVLGSGSLEIRVWGRASKMDCESIVALIYLRVMSPLLKQGKLP